MGARGPRTLDPLSLGSQPSGVTRVTRLVTRCVAPAWDVARCFWHASQIFRGPFGFFVKSGRVFFCCLGFLSSASVGGALRRLRSAGRSRRQAEVIPTAIGSARPRAKPRGRVSDGTVPARAVLSSARGEH